MSGDFRHSDPPAGATAGEPPVVAFDFDGTLTCRDSFVAFFQWRAGTARFAAGVESSPPTEEQKEPAVSIRKSVTPGYLICLEDGKHFKSLKRHLTAHGLTPEQYRTKWKLPSDYPMVAANYAASRSALAKAIGLGQLRGNAAARKRGRPPKAV